ncbi:MAG: (5-formylfuran-3-yl)methyl phosphate synthase [Candidatus Bathyarchaeia archaeon]
MKLLVSIVDEEEAFNAFQGGCDILDVKNPREGSLGAKHPSFIRCVVEKFKGKVEISATIGDLPNLPGTASLAALGAASLGVDYVNAGLLGVDDFNSALNLTSWIVKAVKEEYVNVKVIACCYADYKLVGSLNPIYLPNVAYEGGADGILIDVKTKNRGKVFDYLNIEQLAQIYSKAKKYGLTTALAGGLSLEDISKAVKLEVDVLGVRRGVCDSSEWLHSRVRLEKVRDMKEMILKLKKPC